ncbi:MAG: VacJ family lipoprotein [Alphaproteobacteria bacterium]|nr:VacJ family lipoprotein [Alphaproteobacteria bacterium]
MFKHLIACVAVFLSISFPAFSQEDENWLETYNRNMFGFNMTVDKYIMKPVAKAYRSVTTKDIRNRITSALDNTEEPVTALNYLLQLKPKKNLNSIGRFLINTTLGLGGMFDVASGWGLKKEPTGFDETLAEYCVPDGPFFMAPFFGPFTVRSATGYIADGFSNPIYWAAINDKNYSAKISYSYAAVKAINSRERSLDLLDDLEKNSVDFYSTVRSAYLQNRQKMNQCGSDNVPSYDFDFDDEDY